MSIKHGFTSGKSDGADATLVQPSNWNALHTESAQVLLLADEATSPEQTAKPNRRIFTPRDCILGVDGGAGSTLSLDFNPYDANVFWEKDDFNVRQTASLNVGELGWNISNISGTSAVSVLTSAFPNLGLIKLASGATSGNGGALNRNFSNNFGLGNLAANTNWHLTFVFQSIDITGIQFRIGLVGTTLANQPVNGIWLRFDDATDSQYTYECRNTSTSTTTASGVTPVVNAFHRLDIYSTTAGSIVFQLDGAHQQTISTNVPTVNLQPMLIVATTAAAAKAAAVDFYAFKMSGLGR
jgi:hypothetical protein